jgi:hypothetical protein
VHEELDMEVVDRRDRELGSVIRSWAETHPDVQVELHGPLEAPGMDPTWIMCFRSGHLDADVCLLRGPYLDVAAARPDAPEKGLLVGGEEGEGLSDLRLVQMLDGLADASLGADLPEWLRRAES